MNQNPKTRHAIPTHGAEIARAGDTYSPRVDILETDGEFIFFADVPGVDVADIDLRFADGEVSLHAQVTKRTTACRLSHVEYGVGDFHRSFKIGPYVDAANIRAELTDGVLKVHCPKCQLVDGRQIEVKPA